MVSFGIIFLSMTVMAILVPGIILIVKGIRAGGIKRRLAILIPCIVLFTVSLAGANAYFSHNRVIGTFGGAEYDVITIGGETYRANYDHDHSAADKGKALGKVTYSGPASGQHIDPMYVWEIKGSDEYIYAVWDYDGTIYKKVPG